MRYSYQYLILIFVLLIASCSSDVQKAADQSARQLVKLTNWDYSTNGGKEWNSLSGLSELTNTNKDSIWLRTALPKFNSNFTHIYLGRVNYTFQVFLDEEKIFEYGKNECFDDTGQFGLNQLLIPLPKFKFDDELLITLQLNSDENLKNWGSVLTSAEKVYEDLFLSNIDDLLLSAIFISITIILFVLYLFYLRTTLLLSIIIFISSIAIFTLSNSLFIQLIFPAPILYYHSDYISLVTATVGAFLALKEIVSDRFKTILKLIVIIHLLFLIGSIILVFSTKTTYLQILNYFMIVLSANMLISIVVILLSLKEGRYTTKLVITGMSAFILSAFVEIIIFYTGYSSFVYNYSVQALHFGALLFIIFLIWIAGYHYINSFREKDLARQKELDAVKRESEVKARFARRLIQTQEDERNRIAMELHDSIGQKLLLIKNYLLSEIRARSTAKKDVDSLEEISNLSGETIQEVREITHNLRPQHLDQLGLTTAIETAVERFENSSEISFHFELDDIDGAMPKEDEINYYRIIQESLNNIVKHSNASEAHVTIKRNNNSIIAEIKDNGKMQNLNLKSEGIGITGMRERAKMIKAEISIDIGKSEGTSIKLIYHIEKANRNETN